MQQENMCYSWMQQTNCFNLFIRTFLRITRENIPLQFSAVDASRFIKSHKEGSQVILDFGDTKTSAIVKNIDYDAMKRQVMALDFQALVAGEVVSATVPVHFLNEEIVQGVFEPELSEIHYKADPAHLLDPIEIDLAKLPAGTKNMYVKDLKLEEKGVNVSTPADTQLFHIADFVKTDDDAKMSHEELLLFMEDMEQDGGIDENEGELLRNALEFRDLTAAEILTHRIDLEAVEIDESHEKIARAFTQSRCSRLLVYRDTIDQIVGVLQQQQDWIR